MRRSLAFCLVQPISWRAVRHIGTLLAALAIAPVAWIMLAFGQSRSARAFSAAAERGGLHAADLRTPLLVLAAAGILFGLIGTLRFSPVGALVAGALYVSSYAMLLVAPDDWFSLFDRNLSIAGRQVDLAEPIRSGTTVLLGALLLVAVASVSRWRRRPRTAPVPAAPAETAEFGPVNRYEDLRPPAPGSYYEDLRPPPPGTFEDLRPPTEPEFATRYPTGSRL